MIDVEAEARKELEAQQKMIMAQQRELETKRRERINNFFPEYDDIVDPGVQHKVAMDTDERR